MYNVLCANTEYRQLCSTHSNVVVLPEYHVHLLTSGSTVQSVGSLCLAQDRNQHGLAPFSKAIHPLSLSKRETMFDMEKYPHNEQFTTSRGMCSHIQSTYFALPPVTHLDWRVVPHFSSEHHPSSRLSHSPLPSNWSLALGCLVNMFTSPVSTCPLQHPSKLTHHPALCPA